MVMMRDINFGASYIYPCRLAFAILAHSALKLITFIITINLGKDLENLENEIC